MKNYKTLKWKPRKKYHTPFKISAELNSISSLIISVVFAGGHDAVSESVNICCPACPKRSSAVFMVPTMIWDMSHACVAVIKLEEIMPSMDTGLCPATVTTVRKELILIVRASQSLEADESFPNTETFCVMMFFFHN